MNQEPAQSQSVVLAVVLMLGLVAVVGLVGGMLLIHDAAPEGSVAVVFTTVGGATGALAGILASTRSAPPAPVQQAYQQGAQDTVAFLQAVPPAAPAPPVAEPAHPAV